MPMHHDSDEVSLQILAMDGAAGWFEGTGIPVQEYALPTDRPVPREIPAGALAWVKSDAGACDALIDNYIVMGRLQVKHKIS